MTRHFGSPHRGDYQCDKRDSEGNARPAQGLTGDHSRLFGVHDAEPAIGFGLIHSSPLSSRPALTDGGDVNTQSGALMGDALILFGSFWHSAVQPSWRGRALSQYLRLLRSPTVPGKMARGARHRAFLLHLSKLSALLTSVETLLPVVGGRGRCKCSVRLLWEVGCLAVATAKRRQNNKVKFIDPAPVLR